MHGLAVEPRPVVVELVAVAEVALHARERPQPEAAVVLVRAVTTRERVARRALGQPERRGVGERAREQRLDPGDALGAERERLRLRRAGAADRAARARRVADERRVVGAAFGAARQVRQVAGEPEQLELEREPERVERRALGRVRRLVEQVEEARRAR